MLRLFFRSLLRQLRRCPGLVAISVLGLAVSCFCLSAAQGKVMREFADRAGSNQYATLTLDLDGGEIRDLDAIAGWLDKTYGGRLYNVLYFAADPSGDTYIGWQGTEARRWFPYSSGRFFTEAEERAGAEVVYIQDEIMAHGNSEGLETETVTVNGRELKIVGRGGFADFHFDRAISRDSAVKVMGSGAIRILPYRLFSELFRPVMILIHFDALETREARRIKSEINASFPGVNVYLPNKDPTPIFTQKALRGALEGLLLCLVAGFTVIQLMVQWIGFLRKEIYTYHLCGLSRGRCMAVVYGQWLVWLLTGALAGWGAHRLCLPLMEYFGAGLMPRFWIFLALVAALYILTALCSALRVRGMLALQTRGEGE